MPSFDYERKLKRKGFDLVAGVDEVGRGPLAGPVLACALVLNKTSFREKIDDSKKLSPLQRKKAYQEILKNSVFGVGRVDEKEIDALNIRRATFQAMKMAMLNLVSSLDLSESESQSEAGKEYGRGKKRRERKGSSRSICFLVDGPDSPEIGYYCENIIAGDAKSLSIACASIIAKVIRDNIMCDYHHLYPEYGFTRHKGYGTAEHLKALVRFGQSPIHRRSFQIKAKNALRSFSCVRGTSQEREDAQ